jgi:hypothetical protein
MGRRGKCKHSSKRKKHLYCFHGTLLCLALKMLTRVEHEIPTGKPAAAPTASPYLPSIRRPEKSEMECATYPLAPLERCSA